MKGQDDSFLGFRLSRDVIGLKDQLKACVPPPRNAAVLLLISPIYVHMTFVKTREEPNEPASPPSLPEEKQIQKTSPPHHSIHAPLTSRTPAVGRRSRQLGPRSGAGCKERCERDAPDSESGFREIRRWSRTRSGRLGRRGIRLC